MNAVFLRECVYHVKSMSRAKSKSWSKCTFWSRSWSASWYWSRTGSRPKSWSSYAIGAE